jgi:hypothetical protein
MPNPYKSEIESFSFFDTLIAKCKIISEKVPPKYYSVNVDYNVKNLFALHFFIDLEKKKYKVTVRLDFSLLKNKTLAKIMLNQKPYNNYYSDLIFKSELKDLDFLSDKELIEAEKQIKENLSKIIEKAKLSCSDLEQFSKIEALMQL